MVNKSEIMKGIGLLSVIVVALIIYPVISKYFNAALTKVGL